MVHPVSTEYTSLFLSSQFYYGKWVLSSSNVFLVKVTRRSTNVKSR
jgi:hypothetical protein